MHNIEHIFFDLDRTLWDFERNSAETLSELFYELKLHENGIGHHAEFIGTYIVKNEYCWELYRQNKISKAELRSLRFRLALQEHGIENDSLAHALGEAYVERSPKKTALFPSALEVLEYLSSKYTLHIITNGFEEVQHIKMERSGLKPYFKCITTSEMAGCKKPDEQIFKHALALASASPYNSVMIGDDKEVDVMGALNIGMKAILFSPDKEETSPHYHHIQDLNELRHIL